MAGVRVNTKLVPVEGGKHDIQVDILPEGASLFVVLILSPDSARNVADLLHLAAKKAEGRVIGPTFDSVPPVKA